MSLSAYYELNGKNLDRYLIDTTSEYVSENESFKKLTLEKVSKIINYSRENYNEIQKDTLEYILENCRFTIAAKKWMEKKLREIVGRTIFRFDDEKTNEDMEEENKEDLESFQDALVLGEIIGKKVEKEEKNYFTVGSVIGDDGVISSFNEKFSNFLQTNGKKTAWIVLSALVLFSFYYFISNQKKEPVFLVPSELQKSVSYSYLKFPRNNYYLETSFIKTLKNLKEILIKNPNIKLEIIGYTSAQGRVERNIQVAQLRATFVYNYFIEYKIPRNRLEIKTYIASEKEISSSSHNYNHYRRVIFRLKPLNSTLQKSSLMLK